MHVPSIETLHQEKNIKDKFKHNIFETVLSKCIQQIIETNARTEYTFVYFEVPNIIIGSPYYNRMSCVKYLINKLSEQKYKVEFIDPFYLYIDWGTLRASNLNQKIYTKTKDLLKKYPNVSDITFDIQ
jgi:hypothetical protein